MTKHVVRGSIAAVLSIPVTAFAHPGHDAITFVAGFTHPFGGLDHLLAMIAVGILASRFEASARWGLPLAFILAMTVGAALAAAGFATTNEEMMIALSLVAFGVAVAAARTIPLALALGAVSSFAIFHGYAHGLEMIGSSLFAFVAGFVVSTALLHAASLWLTLQARTLGRRAQSAIRISGGVIAGTGIALLGFAFP
jgi:urease accessory protein